MSSWPDFDSLPVREGLPEGCAWGVFDKDGKKDVYGCLNKITPEIAKAAAAEIKDGISVSLNWPIGGIKQPGFLRKGLVHKVKSFIDPPFGFHGFDDEVEFNTQCSSQWDSLCHFFHQSTARGYNDANPTIEDLVQDFGHHDKDKKFPTLNHWHERGGLIGRGVLIDYKAYAEKKGIRYSPFDNHKITTAEIEDVARMQGVTFETGDVIIIRSGFTEELGAANAEQQAEMIGTHKACGVEGSKESAKWFWNQHFGAVAGDTIAFEVVPPVVEKNGVKEDGTIGELVLHQYFLSLFGLNIGELWDLKALSEHCAKTGRYTFFLTSSPLNVPGLIGSPPNALAIF